MYGQGLKVNTSTTDVFRKKYTYLFLTENKKMIAI